jgi:hypothetical protein
MLELLPRLATALCAVALSWLALQLSRRSRSLPESDSLAVKRPTAAVAAGSERCRSHRVITHPHVLPICEVRLVER